MDVNEVVEAPGSVWSQPAGNDEERNVARRSVLTAMLKQKHNAIGAKIIKGMFMRPKRRAGQPATGKGEWRGMARKAKAQPQQKQPKKERR